MRHIHFREEPLTQVAAPLTPARENSDTNCLSKAIQSPLGTEPFLVVTLVMRGRRMAEDEGQGEGGKTEGRRSEEMTA